MSLVGKPAPHFTLPSTKDFNTLAVPVSLDDYEGRWLVLLFYPADFTFVCPTEVLAFSSRVDELRDLECDIVGVSTDSVHCHQAWCEFAIGKLQYPLASDRNHAVCRAYGVLDEEHGVAQRALMLIDPDGIVRYELIHDADVGRNPDELLRVLQALRAKTRTPAGWQPGQAPLAVA